MPHAQERLEEGVRVVEVAVPAGVVPRGQWVGVEYDGAAGHCWRQKRGTDFIAVRRRLAFSCGHRFVGLVGE